MLVVANGAFREAELIPMFDTVPGLLLSGLLLSCLILAVAYLFLPWLGARAPLQLLLIGLGWLVITLIFEFSFGLLRGKALADLLDAYTFKDGNICPVVLVITVVAPWLPARFRGWL